MTSVYVFVRRVEVVERSWRDSLPIPLLSCELWMFVKENPDRKENIYIYFYKGAIHVYTGITKKVQIFKCFPQFNFSNDAPDWHWFWGKQRFFTGWKREAKNSIIFCLWVIWNFLREMKTSQKAEYIYWNFFLKIFSNINMEFGLSKGAL